MKKSETILIQGAMNLELAYFLSQMKEIKPVNYAGFSFWTGKLADREIVLSKTGVGTALAGATTAIGIAQFHPSLVLNQGTSGAYLSTLGYGDIVVGERVFNGNALHSSLSGATQYIALDKLENESDFSKMFLAEPTYYKGDEAALECCLSCAAAYTEGRVVKGTIASFDQWNICQNRIKVLQKETGAVCEEMEAGGAATVAQAMNTPFLAVRVISNNNTTLTRFKGETAAMCQSFILQLLKVLPKNM